ncbi:MAG: aldo/keto reductase [Bacteroidota bacterium]
MFQATTLSENGPIFSRIVSGVMTWGIWGKDYDTQGMNTLLNQAVALGITTIDHADIYGHYTTEAAFGAALAKSPDLRSEIQLISKCGIKLTTPNRPSHKIKSYDTSKEHILQSVDQSLSNLQTDYLDLLLIHRPSPLLDADEVGEAFESLKFQGKVKHFGVSNFTVSQMELFASRFSIVTNQIEANLMHLAPFIDGTLDYCQTKRFKPMAWSPLGGSAFFGNPDDERVNRIQKVAQELAEKYGDYQVDQILLAWLLRHPAKILPVLGTGRIERLEAAIQAAKLELSREDWFVLWSASIGAEVP